MLRMFQKRRYLAVIRQEVEAVLLAAQPDQALSVAEVVRQGWGYRPEDRSQHYDLYHDVRSVLKRLQDVGLAEIKQQVGQPKRWRATEEARALQMHQNYEASIAA